MNPSTGFFEFIFSETPRDFKAAYESLDSEPYQIFDLLLKEERFKNFFSRIEVYGNNLGYLLSQFPSLQQYGYSTSLLQEIIKAFTLSLLTEKFDGRKSRSAVARIVISVVNLSDPRTLGQFGVRLGGLPEILRILIAEEHIKKLAQTDQRRFEDLISEPRAQERWVEFITDLCKGCRVHRSGPRRTGGVELAKFIRTVPCEFCTTNFSFNCGPSQNSEGEPTGAHDYSLRPVIESNVFEYLLGEPLGPWKIVLSQQAMEDLGEENAQGNFENVRRKFYELASGEWAGKKILHRAKWENSLNYRIPLFNAFYKTGSFILWQIDTAFDERFSEDYQVIKVWAIGKHKNLGRTGVQIHRAQQVYTKAQVGACKRGELDRSRGIRYPVRVCLDGKERGVIEGPPRLEKFYSLTTAILDNISSTARKVACPVVLSAEEATVVDHFITPAFVRGSSGTGKTTCLVYKLVGRYLNSIEKGEPLRQVLLTKSKRLVSKLGVSIDGLIEAKLGDRKRVTESNYSRNGGLDDNTRKQFSSLTNADFPLICTFDCLLTLIENSIREQENQRRYIKIDNSKCSRIIDFVKFRIEYWDRLSPRLKRGIRVDLAFLEIMGVIKGSVSAADLRPLSREEYLGKRWRLAPNFASHRERDAVYSIYEWYERTKKKRGDIDQTDRIVGVTKTLAVFRSSEVLSDNVFEQKIRSILDEIYVDGVQDHRTLDIRMLLTLVGSPLGIHLAGDTAQCISKDALFRFANAKSLFHERFWDSTSSARGLVPIPLVLSHNFRSNKQILSVASFIMRLLYRGFPDLVDEPPSEIGDRTGPKPTLYIGNNIIDILRFEEKMENPMQSDGPTFRTGNNGEVRVILVRDEETRDKLRTEMGRSWLVLTVLQSKGMEFEDVFLYNFLSTSPYRHKLNVLEELFKRRAAPGSGHDTSAYPRSHKDWQKENIILFSELKHLYVGVTRARNRLWILETSTRILDPVQRLFNQTATLLQPDLYPDAMLDVLTEDNIGVSELHRRLSTEGTISALRWREMGYQMIDSQQYSEALHCFENAEDPHGITLSNAYITEEIGLTNRAFGSFDAANLHFLKASEFFLQAGSVAKAVQSRKEGSDPKGAVRILADNGVYEDAAWLAADVGLFSETGELYTKLNQHQKALAGYARGKQFRWMLNYLRRFKSEIEPCCWKQYLLFGYLEEFGVSDTIPGQLERRTLHIFGSPEEQEMVLSRFNLMNKLFGLLSNDRKYMEAYEVGVNYGLLEKSIQLLSDKNLLQDLNQEQVAHLNVACKFLQAEHMATNPLRRTGGDGGIHKVLRTAAGRGSPQIDSFVSMWEDISQALDSSAWRRISVKIGEFGDPQITGYVNILATRGAYPSSRFRPPLDHIERVLRDLKVISSGGTIPPSAQLYCGIYEMPRQPGGYIVLEWSPLHANSKPRLPCKPVGIESLRDNILSHISGDIIPPLVSLEEWLQKIWSKKMGSQFVVQTETNAERVDLLARLCQIFLETSAIVKHDRQLKDSLQRNWDWRFWRVALLEQMEFRSPCKQSLKILLETRAELVTREGKYHVLYPVLVRDDTTDYQIESAAQMGVGACVSSLLAQYQTSLFLGYQEQWRSALVTRTQMINRGDGSLKYGSEIVTLVHRFLSETEAGDFPGRFCENICKILSALERVKETLNCYSASIISLYEELTLSLISVVRRYELLIPESWHRLYFHRWERKYRSSALERFRYQQFLVKVCLSFCNMVMGLEGRGAEGIDLAQRSVSLIVVSLINLGTCFPQPQEYAELWRKSQELFRCDRLDFHDAWNLGQYELLGCLTRVFEGYGGNDSIHLVSCHPGSVSSFSGIPLNGSGVLVVKGCLTEGRNWYPWEMSRDQLTRQLNAAHILTAFWKRSRPRVLKMRELRRQRLHAIYANSFPEIEWAESSREDEETQEEGGQRYGYFDDSSETEQADISEDEETQEPAAQRYPYFDDILETERSESSEDEATQEPAAQRYPYFDDILETEQADISEDEETQEPAAQRYSYFDDILETERSESSEEDGTQEATARRHAYFRRFSETESVRSSGEGEGTQAAATQRSADFGVSVGTIWARFWRELRS
ncbi:unnamed protein product [Tuber aestivum]|uniref:UvrD-like helicase ATP-binding domain-containing protein n=1 Tax=Tuber aestivum TaxID=59557 RepID=A0A292PX76_9PEZI|nr:unnamed protein product [Tuber aestivum]